MSAYVSLSYSDLLLAGIFLGLNAVFSILLQLGLTRSLVISAARMTVQLFLVGLVLIALAAVAVVMLSTFYYSQLRTVDRQLAAEKIVQ